MYHGFPTHSLVVKSIGRSVGKIVFQGQRSHFSAMIFHGRSVIVVEGDIMS